MQSDVIIALTNHLADEYNDVITYMELARKAGNADGISQILMDIAKEEYTHACHIEEILKDCGKSVSETSELKNKAQNILLR